MPKNVCFPPEILQKLQLFSSFLFDFKAIHEVPGTIWRPLDFPMEGGQGGPQGPGPWPRWLIGPLVWRRASASPQGALPHPGGSSSSPWGPMATHGIPRGLTGVQRAP